MNTENVGGLSLKSGFWEIRPAFKDDPHDPRGLHLSRSGVGLARDSQGRIYDRVRIIFASRLVRARCFWTCLQEARHIRWHAGDVTVLSKVFCIRQEASPNPGCIFLAKRIK